MRFYMYGNSGGIDKIKKELINPKNKHIQNHKRSFCKYRKKIS